MRHHKLRSFPRKRESSSLALGPRFRGDERVDYTNPKSANASL